jgi:hypothetical protein
MGMARLHGELESVIPARATPSNLSLARVSRHGDPQSLGRPYSAGHRTFQAATMCTVVQGGSPKALSPGLERYSKLR